MTAVVEREFFLHFGSWLKVGFVSRWGSYFAEIHLQAGVLNVEELAHLHQRAVCLT